MKNNLKIIAAFMIFMPSSALAENKSFDKEYFTVKSSGIEFSVKETDEAPPLETAPFPDRTKSVAAAGIVNTGVQAWNVINSGRPDGAHTGAYASAVPGGQWVNFSGWKKKELTYTYTVTNLMRVDVIKVKYKVAFFYGGTDQRSQDTVDSGKENFLSPDNNRIKGSYIANFTVRPIQVDVKWGFKYSLNVAMSEPMNIGTSNDPLAYMQADLNWNVSTPFYSNGGIYTYGVDGAGSFKDLTEKTSELTRQLPKAEIKPVSVNWN